LLSQGNKQSALKGIVTSEDGAALRATNFFLRDYQSSTPWETRTEEDAAFHSCLIRVARTSLFRMQRFSLFPREYVFKSKAVPFSVLDCAKIRILDYVSINRGWWSSRGSKAGEFCCMSCG